MNYSDATLEYAATARCKCGAGLAHPLDFEESINLASWVCSECLKGNASEHDSFPFAFYKVREETSINNAHGVTTRPNGTVARMVGHATCGECGHKWESEPYEACGKSHHWLPGDCPQCGNDCGGHGTYSLEDKRPRIEKNYSVVVLDESSRGNQ